MCNRRHGTGQALAEFGIVLPILIMLMVGTIEVGWGLYEIQVASSLAREGSNLISRNTTISDAGTALSAAASTGPVRINTTSPTSRVVFSVVTLGTAGANNGEAIITNRNSIGSLTASSKLGNPPQSSYGNSRVNFEANDPTNDTSIRMTGTLPGGFTLTAGERVYVTEVITKHTSIAPFIPLPGTLYAVAYF